MIHSQTVSYFPIQQRWRTLKPFFFSEECKLIWRANMLEYSQQRAESNGYKYTPSKRKIMTPSDYESCDWRLDRHKRGPEPEFWFFVCHSACHWLVDMCLFVACMACTKTDWRIITSDKHSTVWNGDRQNAVLFDANFSAIGVAPLEAWALAYNKGKILEPGEFSRPWALTYKTKRMLGLT